MSNQIQFWDPYKNTIQKELVYGDKFIKWLYQSKLGKIVQNRPIEKFISHAYGSYQNFGISKNKVKPFVKKFDLDMEQFKQKDYKSFNDFFIREFKPNQRSFTKKPEELPAFAEGRYFGSENISSNNYFPVKGINININTLLDGFKGDINKNEFNEGPMLIARLCPVDYHRFHFPDDGEIVYRQLIEGPLDSVNPLALEHKPEILVKNERQISVLKTKNFKTILNIEVGALCVGKIKNSTECPQSVTRGQEKGYFLFGGSTSIIIGQNKAWKPNELILKNSKNNLETYYKLGDQVAIKSN